MNSRAPSLVGCFAAAWVVFTTLTPSLAVAQSGAMTVENDNVGIGTATPAFRLHLVGTDSTTTRVQVTNTNGTAAERTLFNLTNHGFPRFVLTDSNSGAQWVMAAAGGGSFVFNETGSPALEFRVAVGGHLTIAGQMTATGYNTSSSRELKAGFQAVDSQAVLSRLAALPISEWSFSADPGGTRHLGPVAEDFRAAFGLGADPGTINLMDATGVALVAIQGLHEAVRVRDAELAALRAQNTELAGEIAELRRLVQGVLEAR